MRQDLPAQAIEVRPTRTLPPLGERYPDERHDSIMWTIKFGRCLQTVQFPIRTTLKGRRSLQGKTRVDYAKVKHRASSPRRSHAGNQEIRRK